MTRLLLARPIAASLTWMVNGSANVLLTRPRVLVFELYRAGAGLADALLYVLAAGALAALIGLMAGPQGAVQTGGRLIIAFLFLACAFYLVGRLRGSRGSFGGVACCVALFFVPLWLMMVALSLLLAVTVVGIALVPLLMLATPGAFLYFGVPAAQASLKLTGTARPLAVAGAATLAMIAGDLLLSLASGGFG